MTATTGGSQTPTVARSPATTRLRAVLSSARLMVATGSDSAASSGCCAAIDSRFRTTAVPRSLYRSHVAPDPIGHDVNRLHALGGLGRAAQVVVGSLDDVEFLLGM